MDTPYEKIRRYMRYSDLKDRELFYVLCAAMDSLHDTEDAMCAYLNLEPGSKYSGIEYVYAYGILNVLEVQQDVLKVIYEILTGNKLNINSYESLKKVRKIRNDVFGHPVVYKSKDKEFKGIGITRYNLSCDYFQATDFSKFGQEDSVKYKVDVKEIIKLQFKDVDDVLVKIINYLENNNENYKKMIKEDEEFIKTINESTGETVVYNIKW